MKIKKNFLFEFNILSYFTAGIISLLDEPTPALKIYALQKLNTIVNEFWPEISDVIDKM